MPQDAARVETDGPRYVPVPILLEAFKIAVAYADTYRWAAGKSLGQYAALMDEKAARIVYGGK